MPSERITFPGAFGDELAARLERPAGEPVATALFAHCFTCSKDLRAVREISRTLCSRGYTVLRFDFTGLGESEGDFEGTDFSSNVEDLVAAADYLRNTLSAPQVLIGHSLGGAAVLVAAGRIPEAQAVATIAAPSETDHLRESILRQAPELEDTEKAEVDLGGRLFRIQRRLLDDLEAQNIRRAVRDLGRALMVFHSPLDDIVDIDHAARIYKLAEHPKSFVSLDDADHLLTRTEDARFVGEVLAAWATRFVDGDWGEEELNLAEIGRVVARGGPSGYAVDISMSGHTLRADEPLPVGNNTGPDPYNLLLAALGACKVMTLRMYADRKGWPLEGSRIDLSHSRIHAEDCAECETQQGMIDHIDSQLEVDGPLSDEQRDRLLDMANKCPVHRTLVTETRIVSN